VGPVEFCEYGSDRTSSIKGCESPEHLRDYSHLYKNLLSGHEHNLTSTSHFNLKGHAPLTDVHFF
jgi:hypothetical protein